MWGKVRTHCRWSESKTTAQERSCNLLIGDSSGWVSSKEDLINITKVTSVITYKNVCGQARLGRRTVLLFGTGSVSVVSRINKSHKARSGTRATVLTYNGAYSCA